MQLPYFSEKVSGCVDRLQNKLNLRTMNTGRRLASEGKNEKQ